MLIEIFGTGCSRCNALFETVKALCAEEGVDAEVRKVSDFPACSARAS